MSDPAVSGTSSPLFAAPPPARSGLLRTAVLSGFAALLFVFAFVLYGRHSQQTQPAGAIQPLDPQAATLPVSQIVMSESTSLSGGKSTFIDGHIRNTGAKTVHGITVQVLFRNDVGLAPQVETLPLSLIRTHEPYVDTQPVSAAPIAPGDDREFRLIFENINDNWNIQLPEIHIIHVANK